MARKPNYDFERRERDRLKAEKKAARAKAKAEKLESRKADDTDQPLTGEATAEETTAGE